jgi:hypothetical protein
MAAYFVSAPGWSFSTAALPLDVRISSDHDGGSYNQSSYRAQYTIWYIPILCMSFSSGAYSNGPAARAYHVESRGQQMRLDMQILHEPHMLQSYLSEHDQISICLSYRSQRRTLCSKHRQQQKALVSRGVDASTLESQGRSAARRKATEERRGRKETMGRIINPSKHPCFTCCWIDHW